VSKSFKQLTDFLIAEGVDDIGHTNKSYLAHLIGVYKYMEARGCPEEVCRAGMFHSIYGTELFQGFKLSVDRRADVRALIGDRAERLAYMNCAMDRPAFDRALEQVEVPFPYVDRLTGETTLLSQADFDDLCRIHLYDWLEQVPRSRWWEYRRGAYERIAARLAGIAKDSFDRVYAEARTEVGTR
jgi:hypothetical protein